AGEAKFPLSEGGVQSRQKLTPEHATEDPFGQEKVVGADDPVALVQRQSAPRHDAMDVRMEVEFLPPGVERHEHTDLGPEVFGISGQLNQGFRGSLHQQAVNSAGIVKGDRAEITGKREDNMEVRHGQQIGCLSLQPAGRGGGLPLRAEVGSWLGIISRGQIEVVEWTASRLEGGRRNMEVAGRGTEIAMAQQD